LLLQAPLGTAAASTATTTAAILVPGPAGRRRGGRRKGQETVPRTNGAQPEELELALRALPAPGGLDNLFAWW